MSRSNLEEESELAGMLREAANSALTVLSSSRRDLTMAVSSTTSGEGDEGDAGGGNMPLGGPGGTGAEGERGAT
jgi:hypothetical protein